jgi:phycocyanin alpha chain
MPNCNRSDPTLSGDKSLSIEGGPPIYFWLSPDISLFHLRDDIKVEDGAIISGENFVDVKVHRNLHTLLPSTFGALVELWVCNPSLVMIPSDCNSARLLFKGCIELFPNPSVGKPAWLPEGGDGWLTSLLPESESINGESYPPELPVSGETNISRQSDGKIRWVPNPVDPLQKIGHKCLISRVYQDGLPGTKPDNDCFHVQADDHVAQRNLSIVPVSVTTKKLSFAIQTIGINPDNFETLIRVVADHTPTEALLNAINPSLEDFPGYKQLASISLDRFALRIPNSLSPVVRDYTRVDAVRPDIPSLPPILFPEIIRYINRDIAGRSSRFRNAVFKPEAIAQEKLLAHGFGRPTAVQLAAAMMPTYEADVQLLPGEVSEISLEIELPASSQDGDAYIFHVTQIDLDQEVVGGITVVAVVITPPHIEAADKLASKRPALVRDGLQEMIRSGALSSHYCYSNRRYAACLRDLEYYVNFIIESCRQDSVQPLDRFLSGVREVNASLGYSNSWFVTFYQSVKNNHGLTGEAATIANSYLDYAINFFA